MMKPARAATRRLLPTSPFGAEPPAPPAELFAEQDQVTHDKYGLGRVVSVEDDATVRTLARQIARAHGGDVIYQARNDGGSSFTLRLPTPPERSN